MQILCPRTWRWASTTWRWTVEKKKDSWAVSGCLKRTTCMACHSEEPRFIILLSSSILGCGPRSGQQRTTGRQKSQDRETPHWNSVCMSWGGGRAVLSHVPCQAHSIPEFECHQLHTASSSSLLFVMTAPLVSELTSLCRPHSSLCFLFHCWLTPSRK